MAKKCIRCGFVNNPAEAHYCGKCGSNIALGGHVWKTYDSTTHKIYKGDGNTIVSDYRLNELHGYEQKVKNSFWIKTKIYISEFWEWVKEDMVPIVVLLGSLAFVCGCVYLIIKGCSSTSQKKFPLIEDIGNYNLQRDNQNEDSSSEKKLMRIEVDGKYGIGYDQDYLLVPAKYYSISEQPIGKDQWLISDPNTGKVGVAFVTDSLQGIIEPTFEDIQIGYGRYSLLRTLPKGVKFPDEYQYVVKDGKILNEEPFACIKAVGTLNDSVIFLDRMDSSSTNFFYSYQLYNNNLEKIGPVYQSVIISQQDEVVIAERRDESVLYDLTGNRLTDKHLRYVKNFSEGVSWAYVTKNDYRNGRLSLIDKKGEAFFSVDAAKNSYPVDFSEGIGWYKNSKGVWIAVDKNGKVLFNIDASYVHPFTMGLAPVYKEIKNHQTRLGFVDKDGRTVIPFIYKSISFRHKSSKYHRFGLDSLMPVRLDGKSGKLHRDGTFYPDE